LDDDEQIFFWAKQRQQADKEKPAKPVAMRVSRGTSAWEKSFPSVAHDFPKNSGHFQVL
jgi:hypothetical protein